MGLEAVTRVQHQGVDDQRDIARALAAAGVVEVEVVGDTAELGFHQDCRETDVYATERSYLNGLSPGHTPATYGAGL